MSLHVYLNCLEVVDQLVVTTPPSHVTSDVDPTKQTYVLSNFIHFDYQTAEKTQSITTMDLPTWYPGFSQMCQDVTKYITKSILVVKQNGRE